MCFICLDILVLGSLFGIKKLYRVLKFLYYERLVFN